MLEIQTLPRPNRYRIAYRKLEPLRFTGHLDLLRIWERTLRRARVPMAFSQGFNPRPRINMSSALPLGFTSDCELLDIWLDEALPPAELLQSLRQSSIPGIEITTVEALADSDPTLQQRIQASCYRVILPTSIPGEEVRSRCDELLAMPECSRSRRGKPYDLRPLILELACEPEGDDSSQLNMTLSAQEGATGRPDEVLLELGYEPALARIHRVAFLLK